MQLSKIVASVGMAVAVAACEQEKDISQNTAIVGQSVTLSGEVEEIRGTVAKLDTDRGDIVVLATNTLADVKAGDRVSVSGQIRRMSVVEIEREFDLDLDPEYELEVDSANILVATAMNKV